MMHDFIQINHRTFYADIWPQIERQVDAIESNWEDAKKGIRPLIIKWGYKDKSTQEKIILAITQADEAGEKYWADKSLISNTRRKRIASTSLEVNAEFAEIEDSPPA